MSFNVRGLNVYGQIPTENLQDSIFNFILKEDPDIVAIQEAHHTLEEITQLDLKYPYKYVDFNFILPRERVINALYCKYPVLSVDAIKFPESSNGALFADILMQEDTVRFYNVHLQSFKVVPKVDYFQNEESGKLLKRINKVLQQQEEQSLIIQEHVINSPYPVILSGDFNNTQFSKVYRVMRSNLQDSFLEAGAGFGKTFKIFGLPMRIDYIFADEHFEITTHTNYNIELSDHEPIMAKIRLIPNE
ncbi:MAG: endonuclease/exonuclease/phosphatase family protein [Bacteroidota bacterium]